MTDGTTQPTGPHQSQRLAELAYEEAVRITDRASAMLDSMRERGSTAFAGAVLVTAFFGGLAARDNLTWLSWVAIGLLGLVTIMALTILFPTMGWKFGLEPSGLLDVADKSRPPLTETQIVRGAARSLEEQAEGTGNRMRWLVWAFRIECLALALEVVAWILDLATR